MTIRPGEVPDSSAVTQEQAQALSNAASQSGSTGGALADPALTSCLDTLQKTLEPVASTSVHDTTQTEAASLDGALSPTQVQALQDGVTALHGMICGAFDGDSASMAQGSAALENLCSQLPLATQQALTAGMAEIDKALDQVLELPPPPPPSSVSSTNASTTASAPPPPSMGSALVKGPSFLDMMSATANLTSNISQLQAMLAQYGQQAASMDQNVSSLMLQEAEGATTLATQQAQQTLQQEQQQEKFHLFGHIIKAVVHVVVAVVHVVSLVVTCGASAASIGAEKALKHVAKGVVKGAESAGKMVAKSVTNAVGMLGQNAGGLTAEMLKPLTKVATDMMQIPLSLPTALASSFAEADGSVAGVAKKAEGADHEGGLEEISFETAGAAGDGLSSLDFDIASGNRVEGDAGLVASDKKAEESESKAKKLFKEILESIASGRPRGDTGAAESNTLIGKMLNKLPISADAKEKGNRAMNSIMTIPRLVGMGGIGRAVTMMSGRAPTKAVLMATNIAQGISGATTVVCGTASAIVGGQMANTEWDMAQSKSASQLFQSLSQSANSAWNSAVNSMGDSEEALSQTTDAMLQAIGQIQQSMASAATSG